MADVCVLDASAACALIFREPDHGRVLSALRACRQVLVPQLFRLEVANVARTKVRRAEIQRPQAEAMLAELATWPIEIVTAEWQDAWPLAWKHDLTVYDAAYLWLSLDRNLPLVTLDAAVRRAVGKRALG